jgi:competence protein ComEA
VSDPQPDVPSRALELLDRIDPNTADAETLAALPQLGLKRAQTIIDYRERYKQSRPNDPIAFKRLDDLLRIKGIGVATIDHLQPYLRFPATAPSTQPAGS